MLVGSLCLNLMRLEHARAFLCLCDSSMKSELCIYVGEKLFFKIFI